MHGLRHSVLPPGMSAGQPHPRLERPRLPRQVAQRHRSTAQDEQLSRMDRAPLSGAVRGIVRPGHRQRRGDHQVRGAGHRRACLRRRMDRAGAAGVAHRQVGGRRRVGTGRARRRRSAQPGRAYGHRVREGGPHRGPAALRHPRVQDGEALPRSAHRRHGSRGRAVPDRRQRRRGRLRGTAPRGARRAAAGRRRRLAPRSAGSRTTVAGYPLRHGVSDAAEPPQRRRRRPRCRDDYRAGQAGRHHRRRRYGRRLPRHRAPAGSGVGGAVRAAAETAAGAGRRQPLAHLAEHLPGVGGARRGR